MTKKIWILISILLVATMLLAACGPKKEATTAAAETPKVEETQAPKGGEAQPTEAPTIAPTAVPSLTGKITLWHGWKENEIASLNDVIAAFQAKNPDVTFDVLYVPFDDLRGKFETAAATGEGPSLLIGAADWGPALFNAQLVADVKGEAKTTFLQTINPAALAAVSYKDALIGLPETLKGVVMFRNTKLIPQAPTSFENLSMLAKAATSGDVVGADLERGFFFSAAHLNALGGQLMDTKGNPMFNNEKGVEWVNLLNSFSTAGPTEYYTDNDVNLFKAGKAGIIIDGTWNTASLAEAVGAENVAIDPWPQGMSGYVQTENIYMGANTTDADKAANWAFMEYLLSPEAQALLADPTKAAHIPSVSGVEVKDALMAQEVKAFEGGTAFPVIPEMGAYWSPMDTALKSVFEQGTDPAAALARANNDVTAAVATIQGATPPETPVTGEITLWHGWKENEIASLNDVIAAFQAKNPDVKVNVLYVPFDDLRGKFETAAATGEGPDLLIGAADWGPALYDAQLLTDLTSMSSSVFEASIIPAALGAVQYKGATIGYPETLKGVVIFRNRSIIADGPKTQDEYSAAFAAATKGDVVGADLERGFFFSAGHLYALGGQLMDKEGYPAFNTDKGVEWVNLLKSWSDIGPTEYYTDNDVNLFKAGKAGVIIDGTWNAAGLAEAIGIENLAVDPWPQGLSGYVQTENIYMSSNVKEENKAAAYAFMKFMLSPDAQVLLADPTKAAHIPAISNIKLNDAIMLAELNAFLTGVPFPVIPEMGAYWGPMDNALKSVFDAGADPKAALDQAANEIKAKVDEIKAAAKP